MAGASFQPPNQRCWEEGRVRRSLHRAVLYALLRELAEGAKTWTELHRAAIEAGGTSTTFRTVLRMAMEDGNIEHLGERRPYIITERGLKTLQYLEELLSQAPAESRNGLRHGILDRGIDEG